MWEPNLGFVEKYVEGSHHRCVTRVSRPPSPTQIIKMSYWIEWHNGSVVVWDVRFMVRLALWRGILLCPAGEGAGHKLRVNLSHSSSWRFVVGKINGDLTTGPGVVGGLPHHWQAFEHLGERALPAVEKKLIRELLSHNKMQVSAGNWRL